METPYGFKPRSSDQDAARSDRYEVDPQLHQDNCDGLDEMQPQNLTPCLRTPLKHRGTPYKLQALQPDRDRTDDIVIKPILNAITNKCGRHDAEHGGFRSAGRRKPRTIMENPYGFKPRSSERDATHSDRYKIDPQVHRKKCDRHDEMQVQTPIPLGYTRR